MPASKLNAENAAAYSFLNEKILGERSTAEIRDKKNGKVIISKGQKITGVRLRTIARLGGLAGVSCNEAMFHTVLEMAWLNKHHMI